MKTDQITLKITAGAGGEDSQEWAEMLARMYLRWAKRRGYEEELVEAEEQSAAFRFHGDEGVLDLAGEEGVHRLIRISPFDASGRRHTAFASVEVLGHGKSSDEESLVRSYVLHPYQLVTDHCREVETPEADSVLRGELDELFSHPLS